MKRKIGALILALSLVFMLAGCAAFTMPRPEVKEGSFEFSVTYELNGEVTTVEDTYFCEYKGVSATLEGSFYRAWEGHFDGGMAGDTIKICDTDDGGEIILSFLIYPEYFMGEPDYVENFTPIYELAVYYYDEEGHIIDSSNDEDVLAGFGARVLAFEYGEPIENSFN